MIGEQRGSAIVLSVGMAIIFISVVFIFFIYEATLKTYIVCLGGTSLGCSNIGSLRETFLGVMMIAAFVLVDIMAMYIMVKVMFRSDDYRLQSRRGA